ncbi:MAG: nuclear transport factor 2 family protein [Bacteroidetes bacterium]|nr:nuclear transport factor 2 family protein [Bacteroidota bacterium]
MVTEEQLIVTFYTCFQQRNWRGMVDCYHPDVFFYDPVFENLDGEQVRAMWEMLLGRAKDVKLDFSNVSGADGYGSCNWIAEYRFPATGRKVINRATARFSIQDGKIVEHQDEFSLWKWSAQALGLPGQLIGWSSLLQGSIRKKARANLEKFMASKASSH